MHRVILCFMVYRNRQRYEHVVRIVYDTPQLASLAVSGDYLITLSAVASTFGGIVSPICLAVFEINHEFELRRLCR